MRQAEWYAVVARPDEAHLPVFVNDQDDRLPVFARRYDAGAYRDQLEVRGMDAAIVPMTGRKLAQLMEHNGVEPDRIAGRLLLIGPNGDDPAARADDYADREYERMARLSSDVISELDGLD
jgi:hypothetical protein